jgi:hypothetical protein
MDIVPATAHWRGEPLRANEDPGSSAIDGEAAYQSIMAAFGRCILG